MGETPKILTELNERFGTWDVAWGEVHRLRRGDLDVPIGGDGNALGCFRIIDLLLRVGRDTSRTFRRIFNH